MGQKFCTVCRSAISDGMNFYNNCGTPVDPDIPPPFLQPLVSVGQEPIIQPIVLSPRPLRGAGKARVK